LGDVSARPSMSSPLSSPNVKFRTPNGGGQRNPFPTQHFSFRPPHRPHPRLGRCGGRREKCGTPSSTTVSGRSSSSARRTVRRALDWRLRKDRGPVAARGDLLSVSGPFRPKHPKLHAPTGAPSKPDPERPISDAVPDAPGCNSGRPDQPATRRCRRLALSPHRTVSPLSVPCSCRHQASAAPAATFFLETLSRQSHSSAPSGTSP
jgi:hypothetical protein